MHSKVLLRTTAMSLVLAGLFLSEHLVAQQSTEAYGYDALGRLITVDTSGGQNDDETHSLCYDKSTNRNLFYIQGDAEPTTPAGFAQAWLTGSDHSQTPYEFEIVPTNANPSAGTSKNYFHRKYGIPAITYEVGDDTDLRAVSTGARNLARDLMVRMLGD